MIDLDIYLPSVLFFSLNILYFMIGNYPLVYSFLSIFHNVSLVEYTQEGIYRGMVTLLDRKDGSI